MWNLLIVLFCIASASGLPFGDIFNSATSSFSKIGNDVGKTFQDGAAQAGNGVVDAASVVGNGIHHAGGSIVDAANTVGKSLTDVFNVPLHFFKGVFAWLAEWIMPLLFGLAAIASVVVVLCFLCYAKSICDMCSVCFCCCKKASCLSDRFMPKHNHTSCKTRNMTLLPKTGYK